MGGEKLNLKKDDEILKINSPKDRVAGPYVVVHKDINKRWAIVALVWDTKPCLGIRWFHGKNGNPSSRNYPTWLIIPDDLTVSILNGLQIKVEFRKLIDKFLHEEIEGDVLKNSLIKT